MERKIFKSRAFSKAIDKLLARNMLLLEDFKEFQQTLKKHPDMGDLVQGTGGARKVRLKSSSGGTSGGFSICYFYKMDNERLFLLLIYAKNKQENITPEQKDLLKNMVKIMKSREKYE